MVKIMILILGVFVFSPFVFAQEGSFETYEILAHNGVRFRATPSAIRDAYTRLQIAEDTSKVAYLTVWGEFLHYKIVDSDAEFSEVFYRPLKETHLLSEFGGQFERFSSLLDHSFTIRRARPEPGFNSRQDRIQTVNQYLRTAIASNYSVKWFADSLDRIYAYSQEGEAVK